MSNNKLPCNIKDVRKPIVGVLLNTKIVRPVNDVHLTMRQYLNIRSKCNVFGIVDGKEHIIPDGITFNKLLDQYNKSKCEEMLEEVNEAVKVVIDNNTVINSKEMENHTVKLEITEEVVTEDKPEVEPIEESVPDIKMPNMIHPVVEKGDPTPEMISTIATPETVHVEIKEAMSGKNVSYTPYIPTGRKNNKKGNQK